MNKQSSDHFDDAWANAFEGASMEPSAHVWDKIELSIANAANNSTKKRLLFFKLLAAASISFAAIVGGWQVVNNYFVINNQNSVAEANDDDNNQEKDQLSEKTIESEPIDAQPDVNSNEPHAADNKSDLSNKNIVADNKPENYTNNNISDHNSQNLTNTASDTMSINTTAAIAKIDLNENGLIISKEDVDQEEGSFGEDIKQNMIRTIASLKAFIDFNLDVKEVEPKMVPWLAYAGEDKDSKDNNTNNLWTGLGMSAGSFNPNGNIGSGPSSVNETAALANALDDSFTQNTNPPIIGSENAGSSFGVGLNLGANISENIVLISGINYLQQNTSSRSNLVEAGQDGARVFSSADLATTDAAIEFTNAYDISNTYQTLSIPIQAGYYVLNRKFDVLLLAGFTNDFFLKRSVSDDSGRALGESFSATDDGYSLYTVGGILGTQFSYQIGDHYLIALQPQFRQSINSFTPDGNKPSAVEVSFKLNYLIK